MEAICSTSGILDCDENSEIGVIAKTGVMEFRKMLGHHDTLGLSSE